MTTHPARSLASRRAFDPSARQALLAQAKQRVARQVRHEMQAQGLTKTEMARRMGTSRAVLDRLLDETDTGLTLATLSLAAVALAKRIVIDIA